MKKKNLIERITVLEKDNLLLATEHAEQQQIIENLKKNQKNLTNQIQKIRKFQQVFNDISSTLDRNEVLKMILSAIADLMEAEGASIFLLSKNGKELILEVASNLEPQRDEDKIRVPLGKGIAGHVAQTGEIINIEDAPNDDRVMKTSSKTGVVVQTMLCGPLMVKKRIIGCAQLINKRNDDLFTQDDEQLFTEFSQQAAMAIENATFYTELLDKQEGIDEQNIRLLGVARSIKNIMTSIQRSHDLVQDMVQIANKASSSSQEGENNVKDMIQEMNQVNEHASKTTLSIVTLNDKVNEISDVLKAITSIAEKTNVLSVNAAIEAARAGERGRGFSVVVDEIRKLAAQTHKSTNEIYAMIDTIRTGSNQIELSMKEVMQEIEVSTDLAKHSGNSLREENEIIEFMLSQVNDLAEINQKQNEAASEIISMVERIDN